jgi:hypothetical protein
LENWSSIREMKLPQFRLTDFAQTDFAQDEIAAVQADGFWETDFGRRILGTDFGRRRILGTDFGRRILGCRSSG